MGLDTWDKEEVEEYSGSHLFTYMEFYKNISQETCHYCWSYTFNHKIKLKSLILTTFALENSKHFTELLVDTVKSVRQWMRKLSNILISVFAKLRYGKLRDIWNHGTINFQEVSILWNASQFSGKILQINKWFDKFSLPKIWNSYWCRTKSSSH